MDASQTLITMANRYLHQIAIFPEAVLAELAEAPEEQQLLITEFGRVVSMSDEAGKAQAVYELVERLPRLRALLAGEPGTEDEDRMNIPRGSIDREHQLPPPVFGKTSPEQVWQRLRAAYYRMNPGSEQPSNANDRPSTGGVKEEQQ